MAESFITTDENQSEDEGEEILDDELLAAMESESESGDDTPDVSAGHRGGQTAQGPGGTLEALGEDVVMRVLRMLAPTQLCRFSKVCHWAKELSNGNSLWKGLYFDRWDDPRSHHLERSANRDGWKRVYAARDMAGRAEDERENLNALDQQEDQETQDAFREMQAARRALSLARKRSSGAPDEGGASRSSAMDKIHEAILEFKSHMTFPFEQLEKTKGKYREQDVQEQSPRAGGAVPAHPPSAAATNRARGRAAASGPSQGFGQQGFYTTYAQGPLRTMLRPKLATLRSSQLEVCICKGTGRVHICTYSTAARGCELAQPTEDGSFVCPISGICWSDARHTAEEEDDDGDARGAPGDFEGGSKNHCNLVAAGYDCDEDPSRSMGWGTWLEDRQGCRRP